MSFTRTGIIPEIDSHTSGITIVSSDKVTLEPGEAKLTSAGITLHDGSLMTAVDSVSHVSTYNPWQEVMSLLLTSKAIIHLTINREMWITMEDNLTRAFSEIGYEHRIEHTASITRSEAPEHKLGGKTDCFFYDEATKQDRVHISIVADTFAELVASKADEFADSIKDL